MNPTQTETIRQISFDGPLSVPATILLSIPLIALLLWSLHRERFILGQRITWLFAGLRILCVAIVFWMLLSPTRTTVQTSSTRRSIVILEDVSGSMQTVDPPGSADEIRWLDGTELRNETLSTWHADRAVTALGLSLEELQQAENAIRTHRGEAVVAAHQLAAGQAIDSAAEQLQSIDEISFPAPTNGELPINQLLRQTQRLFNSSEVASHRERCTQLSKGNLNHDGDLQDQLTDLRYRLVGLRNVVQTLAGSLARHEMDALASKPASLLADVSKQSRSQRVRGALASLDQRLLDSLHSKVDIHFAQFDSSVTRVAKPATSVTEAEDDGIAHNPNQSTNLSAAIEHLRKLQQSQPIAAAFVYSDVAHNDTGMRAETGMRATQSDDSADTSSVDTTRLELASRRSGENVAQIQTENVPTPLDAARQLSGLPVYPVSIGNPQRRRDVELVACEAPPIAMRNDDIVIQAHVQAYRCEGERCVVQLIENAKVVDFREVPLDSDFVSRTIRFDRRVSEIGEQNLQISIAPVEGETTVENNFGEVDINVTRNDIKVLLADELPRWEYRYLAQLFRRDAKVEHDELLFRPRLIATGRREATGEFPADETQWDQYDVVILGDVSPERLSEASQQSLIRYLRRRGGTVILIAGDRSMPQAYSDAPLQTILPVGPTLNPEQTDDYAFRITQAGSEHVALMVGKTQQATRDAWNFVNQFSPLHRVSPWRTPIATATNLISVVPRTGEIIESQSDETFLCWQAVGRGRVVYLSGPDTYRLRFLRGDQIHYRFWGQLLRWAIASDLSTGSQFVRVRTDQSRYPSGQPVSVETRLFDEEGEPISGAKDLTMRLNASSGEMTSEMIESENRPGLYVAQFRGLTPGVYRAIPGGDTADALIDKEIDQEIGVSFTVGADLPMEMVDTRCNQVLASQLANLTGGQVLPPIAVEEVIELTDLSPIVSEKMTRVPIWAQWKYLWLVLGCLQTEWIVRKWRGLS